MLDISAYGEPWVEYRGDGAISCSDKDRAGPLHAAQLQSGHVLAVLDLSARLPANSPISPFYDGVDRILGTLEGGVAFAAQGLLQTNDLVPLEDEDRWGMYHVFRVRELLIKQGRGDAHRFALVNARFRGDPGISDRSTQIERLRVSTQFDGEPLAFALESVGDYNAVIRQLITTKSPRYTGTLELPPDTPNPTDVADAICTLLSVAGGTKVQWIKHEGPMSDGVAATCHRSRVTKPYSSFAPIDISTHADLEALLIECLPDFKRRATRFELLTGTVDALIDAKVETDYLESRALKLAVALERVKSVAVPAEQGFVLDSDQWSGVVPELTRIVRQLLVDRQVDSQLIDQIAGPWKLNGLNRKSFGSQIKLLANELGLKVEYRDRSLFLACRNKLVHEGKFYCNAATQEERKRTPPLSSTWEEYAFMVEVLDRIYLSMIGYTGDYLDRRIPSTPKRIGLSEPLIV